MSLSIHSHPLIPIVAVAVLAPAGHSRDDARLPAGTCLASDMVGAQVVDAMNEKHAEIVDLMIDCHGERVACAVIRCDEVDGKEFAVPTSSLRLSIDENGARHVLIGKTLLGSQKSFPAGSFDSIPHLGLDGVWPSTVLHRATEMCGTAIENPVGESLGAIDDLAIDLDDGDVPFAVVAIGGFLGLGEERHPVPLSALEAKENDAGDPIVLLDVSKERLEAAPHFPRGDLPATIDDAYVANLRSHYRGQFGTGLAFATGGSIERASDLVGGRVVGAAGEEIGTIDDLILDRSTGKVEYAIVSCGGFLGIGDEKIVVPLGVLSHGESGASDAVATLDVTKEVLETGVRFDDGLLAKLEDPAALGTIARPFQVRETMARGILPVLASDVIDRELHDADAAKLGSVSDLAIDRATGDVRYAVVLLTEADDDLFAVRWKELHPTASENGVKLDVDAATVRNERRFPTNDWPSESDDR